MAARIVRGACPHDCPDTCAMHVTVEDGRAVKVAGDPEHPITVGFLCGKVSNYLDRVYSDERVLHPLIREGGELRRASWDEALDRVAGGLSRARDEHGGESILPYSYMGTQGLIQGDVMSARVMHALGATTLERTICATRGNRGDRDGARHLARGRPRGVAQRALRDRLGLEPDVDGAASVAQAARRPRGRGANRRRRPVPQPHRARGRRAPAPAAGHRRRAGDRDDAGDRRGRAAGRGVVPRPRRRLRGAARRSSGAARWRSARRSAASRPRTSPASGASSRPRGRRWSASASGHSATWAPRPRTRRSPRCLR